MAALGLAGATAPTAHAQAASGAPGGAGMVGAVSEVVVTGRRSELARSAAVDKTGTRLEDLPGSVQVVRPELVVQQGGLNLKDAIRNASGISPGGQDGFGFSDRFLVRGLDARIYNDGFSDGDQRNGLPHSINGVERIEVMKGPGSALFGSGPPGGTINIVHFAPSSTPDFGGGAQVGSYGQTSLNAYVTGPTGPAGLDARLDALAQRGDGFRGLGGVDEELRPALRWTTGRHVATLAVDARYIAATADPAGLVYVHGAPITGVPRTAHYSTPFSYGDQSLVRVLASDSWSAASFVTVVNRFSYMHRDLSILRNGDGAAVTGLALTGRQLREQHDRLDDFDYELEPVWHFRTGRVAHTLLTGLEARRQDLDVLRATADLAPIADVFAPVIRETSTAGLSFLRDANHSGAIDALEATYLSLYATDQIDLTDRLKLRVGARGDDWRTELTPQVFVPGRLQPNGTLLLPGVAVSRTDVPLSWNVGVLYRLAPGVSPFFGVARSHLAVFSSESTQTGLAPPESALQYEGGVKLQAFGDRLTLTAAGFDVTRKHVFVLVGDQAIFNDQATYGGELDVDARPTPRWRITFNATAQRAELTANPSNPAAQGKTPIGVPAHIANLWTAYTWPLPGGDAVRIGAGVNYRDKLFANALNTNAAPSYVTADLVAAWLHGDWTVSLGVKNISDETWFIAANGAGALPGDGRTVFMSVSLR